MTENQNKINLRNRAHKIIRVVVPTSLMFLGHDLSLEQISKSQKSPNENKNLYTPQSESKVHSYIQLNKPKENKQ